jgi:hypothetical protein
MTPKIQNNWGQNNWGQSKVKSAFFGSKSITKLLESNVTQLNIRSPDAEKMK